MIYDCFTFDIFGSKQIKLTMSYYFFAQDMTDEERAIMHRHAAYLRSFMDKGIVKVFGPVLDPAGAFGMGVLEVENEDQLKDIIAGDPASSINKYEFYPMMAVMPGQ
jgi:uncharacterized protein YciI